MISPDLEATLSLSAINHKRSTKIYGFGDSEHLSAVMQTTGRQTYHTFHGPLTSTALISLRLPPSPTLKTHSPVHFTQTRAWNTQADLDPDAQSSEPSRPQIPHLRPPTSRQKTQGPRGSPLPAALGLLLPNKRLNSPASYLTQTLSTKGRWKVSNKLRVRKRSLCQRQQKSLI